MNLLKTNFIFFCLKKFQYINNLYYVTLPNKLTNLYLLLLNNIKY